jgi:hypothetical protein
MKKETKRTTTTRKVELDADGNIVAETTVTVEEQYKEEEPAVSSSIPPKMIYAWSGTRPKTNLENAVIIAKDRNICEPIWVEETPQGIRYYLQQEKPSDTARRATSDDVKYLQV